MPLSDLGRRAFGAARLDPAIYEEVEHDAGATSQALAIVLLSGAAAALGGMASLHPATLAVGMCVSVLGWGVWAGLCLVIGGRLFPEPQTETDTGELLRVLGFAAVPGIAQVLGVFAPLRTPVLALTHVWMILAMVVAVRQALDYTSTFRAVGVCLAGWLAQVVVVLALLAMLRPLLVLRVGDGRRPTDAAPTAGYLGVVKPSGVAPPIE
ncbi:MAG: hypothetical protein HY271_18845 [Deltaproteobacteria bacterium]|nr:hypothetical protein [Deltaproteobacteria bacterium]